MARRRRPDPQPLDDEPPEWLWGFSTRQWVLENGGRLEGRYEAVVKWRADCVEWLEERDLVLWPHFRGTWHEYKRICREEPHRVLRRPEKEGASHE